MRRVIITEGDGQPVYRRAIRHAATAEVYLPPANPAQSIHDGAGVRLAVRPDGSWQVAVLSANRPAVPPGQAAGRETVVAGGDLGHQEATTLLPDLTDHEAQALVDVLAKRFGWAYVLYDRSDIDDKLGDERAPLTDEQWRRVHHCGAWDELSEHIRIFVRRADLLAGVIEQARITCEFCSALLDPPTGQGEPARCSTCQTEPDPSSTEGAPRA